MTGQLFLYENKHFGCTWDRRFQYLCKQIRLMVFT